MVGQLKLMPCALGRHLELRTSRVSQYRVLIVVGFRIHSQQDLLRQDLKLYNNITDTRL